MKNKTHHGFSGKKFEKELERKRQRETKIKSFPWDVQQAIKETKVQIGMTQSH